MVEEPPTDGSTSEALPNGKESPPTRAIHFTSRAEIESRPGFDNTILVTRENYDGLIGDYGLPVADHVRCQLQRIHERCNQIHGIGWVARTKGKREGYIGGDCADNQFDAKSQYARDRAVARRQIDTDQLKLRIAAALADATIPGRLRAATEELTELYHHTQAVVGQLPREVTRKLRDMAKTGRADVPIEIGYEEPPDPERPDSKPTMRWQRASAGIVRAPRAADSEVLRSLVARVRAVKVAWKDPPAPMDVPLRSLRERVKILDALPYLETEVREARGRWTEFRTRENLMAMVFLVAYDAGQRDVVRVALGKASKAAVQNAWQAARNRIIAANDGRPTRVP